MIINKNKINNHDKNKKNQIKKQSNVQHKSKNVFFVIVLIVLIIITFVLLLSYIYFINKRKKIKKNFYEETQQNQNEIIETKEQIQKNNNEYNYKKYAFDILSPIGTPILKNLEKNCYYELCCLDNINNDNINNIVTYSIEIKYNSKNGIEKTILIRQIDSDIYVVGKVDNNNRIYEYPIKLDCYLQENNADLIIYGSFTANQQ